MGIGMQHLLSDNEAVGGPKLVKWHKAFFFSFLIYCVFPCFAGNRFFSELVSFS